MGQPQRGGIPIKKCSTCIYRAQYYLGCDYISHTGKSRVKQVYDALGVDELTKEAKRALRPENCRNYVFGPRKALPMKQVLVTANTEELRRQWAQEAEKEDMTASAVE